MADGFYRSFMMGSNEDQQRLQLQVMKAMKSASIRDRFANQNSTTTMAAPAGQFSFDGLSHRTLGVRAASRMIRKTHHACHLYSHTAHQTTFMVQPQPNQAGMVMDMEQISYLMNSPYQRLLVYNADYPPGFGPFGFSPATSYGGATNLIGGGPGQGARTQ